MSWRPPSLPRNHNELGPGQHSSSPNPDPVSRSRSNGAAAEWRPANLLGPFVPPPPPALPPPALSPPHSQRALAHRAWLFSGAISQRERAQINLPNWIICRLLATSTLAVRIACIKHSPATWLFFPMSMSQHGRPCLAFSPGTSPFHVPFHHPCRFISPSPSLAPVILNRPVLASWASFGCSAQVPLGSSRPRRGQGKGAGIREGYGSLRCYPSSRSNTTCNVPGRVVKYLTSPTLKLTRHIPIPSVLCCLVCPWLIISVRTPVSVSPARSTGVFRIPDLHHDGHGEGYW
jgi:hypothetical protein